MSKTLISIATRLVTHQQVQAVEQAMIDFGVEDPYSRPLHYATKCPPGNPCEPLAAAFIYLQFDQDDPSYFHYSFDAGYRTTDVDCELIRPDTFLAMVRFATLLKRGQ